jgi:hypothetical protein
MDWQASSVSFQVQIKDPSFPTDLKASPTILAKDTRSLNTANDVQKSQTKALDDLRLYFYLTPTTVAYIRIYKSNNLRSVFF